MNTTTLYDALERHYRKPGAARDGEILLREVEAPGTGGRADLVRIGLWPSRGYSLDVHELKTQRSDWLRELDNPGKADAWWPYCTGFWIVAPAGIVHKNELPTGWGLMEPPASANRRRFRTIVDAEVKTAQLTMDLLATLVRRTDNTRLAEMDKMREEHRAALYKARTEAQQNATQTGLSERMRRRLNLLDELEKLLGAKLDGFTWGDGTTLDQMTPHELAAALADCGDHIRLQQRQARVEELMGRLSYAAQSVLTEMRKVGNSHDR
ncbi:hypothetical protein [Nonomuraea wenchangensis]|uniref:Uncharacterized protein n=1 Tax=Nonomuraea wenchangensis TaxID=568860 RepID=A0A1I0LUN3_9ACTN|nr:hypothetical protein [Nonomuraea wenchangensis]SEU46443.1 hypothetical protein SAMN05421811_12736 [Nonomuraea wenchangensis]